MSKDRNEKNWNQNEWNQNDWNQTAISKAIKEIPLDIPESLMPEQIKERLQLYPKQGKKKKGMTGKKHIIYGSAGTLAAAAALALILIPTGNIGNINGAGTSNTAQKIYLEQITGGVTEDSIDEIQETETEGIPTTTYRDIYQYINTYYEENQKSRSTGMPEATIEETVAAMGGMLNNNVAVKESSAFNGRLAADGQAASEGAGFSYSETNVQVEGVDESNIIKTDGSYIYLLNQRDQTLQILKVDGATLTLVSESKLSSEGENDGLNYSELYLEKDRLILIASSVNHVPYLLRTESNNLFMRTKEIDYSVTRSKTSIQIYDIADRTNPILLNTLQQDGSYQNSRKTDGYLYVYSIFHAAPYVQEKDIEYYIPCIQDTLIPEDRIYMPMIAEDTTSYMVMTALDISSPGEFTSASAVLANWSQFYVSKDSIYMVGYQQCKKENSYSTSKLLKFSYQHGIITAKAETEIPGMIESSYSMDEYHGYLRLVSNVIHYEYRSINGGEYESIERTGTVNGLYIYDENLNQVSSIEDIAPDEYIKSARFMGNIGYFVTFRQTDPLFSVDLSDPYHPAILGELKISGFSEYLHPYGENLLLGIGYEADINTGGTEGIKLSMFDISDPTNVKEFHKLVLPKMKHSSAFYNPKLVLVSAAKNIVGFQMSGLHESGKDVYWGDYYKTFSYDKVHGFSEEITNRNIDGSNWYVDSQAIYIGDYLYILENSYRFSIYDLNTNEYIMTWGED